MTEKQQPDGAAASGKGQATAEARRRRKAALLRENLMKRKAQTRERGPDGPGGDGAGPAGQDSEK
jgi:hypothetical protein